MRKIIISVAPTAATNTVIDSNKLSKEVIASERAGAAMVHMHVRNKNGELTADTSHYIDVVEKISGKSDIVIQASTGGVSGLTIEERCAPLAYNKVEMVSLNVGSVNLGEAVYQNPLKDVQYCISEIIKASKYSEVEVFEIGMISAIKEFATQYKLPKPLLINIVLGHKGGAPATIDALIAMRSMLPDNAIWGITHAGRQNFELITAAVTMGASLVRVGFEDSNMLTEREVAKNNVELVEKTAKILTEIGYTIATPKDLRELISTERSNILL